MMMRFTSLALSATTILAIPHDMTLSEMHVAKVLASGRDGAVRETGSSPPMVMKSDGTKCGWEAEGGLHNNDVGFYSLNEDGTYANAQSAAECNTYMQTDPDRDPSQTGPPLEPPHNIAKDVGPTGCFKDMETGRWYFSYQYWHGACSPEYQCACRQSWYGQPSPPSTPSPPPPSAPIHLTGECCFNPGDGSCADEADACTATDSGLDGAPKYCCPTSLECEVVSASAAEAGSCECPAPPMPGMPPPPAPPLSTLTPIERLDVTLSSVWVTGPVPERWMASNLIDDDLSTNVATGTDDHAWASIRVPAGSSVGYVAVYNRNDEWTSDTTLGYLSPFVVIVADQPGQAFTLDADGRVIPGEQSHVCVKEEYAPVESGIGPFTAYCRGEVGTYVTIYLEGKANQNRWLNLAEVKIFAA